MRRDERGFEQPARVARNLADHAKQFAKLYGVDTGRMYLQQGATVETLLDLCNQIDPSILIIGSIARTGIRGKLIGNTAEKLLDTVDADVLTVN